MKTLPIKTKPTQARRPDFPFSFRLPPVGEVDPWWSLNRSAWNTLILPHAGNKFRPPVKSVTTRQPGKKRGIRLIIFESAKAHFDKMFTEQQAA